MGKNVSYELVLHHKQGDDFAECLRKSKSPAAALRLWAARFKENQEACEKLAKALEGQLLGVMADTHMISFEPGDASAEQVLQQLVKEELLRRDEIDGDDDED